MVFVAGVLPIAVIIKLKERVASAFDENLTLFVSNMVASLPDIEYAESPQSGLLYVYEASI